MMFFFYGKKFQQLFVVMFCLGIALCTSCTNDDSPLYPEEVLPLPDSSIDSKFDVRPDSYEQGKGVYLEAIVEKEFTNGIIKDVINGNDGLPILLSVENTSFNSNSYAGIYKYENKSVRQIYVKGFGDNRNIMLGYGGDSFAVSSLNQDAVDPIPSYCKAIENAQGNELSYYIMKNVAIYDGNGNKTTEFGPLDIPVAIGPKGHQFVSDRMCPNIFAIPNHQLIFSKDDSNYSEIEKTENAAEFGKFLSENGDYFIFKFDYEKRELIEILAFSSSHEKKWSIVDRCPIKKLSIDYGRDDTIIFLCSVEDNSKQEVRIYKKGSLINTSACDFKIAKVKLSPDASNYLIITPDNVYCREVDTQKDLWKLNDVQFKNLNFYAATCEKSHFSVVSYTTNLNMSDISQPTWRIALLDDSGKEIGGYDIPLKRIGYDFSPPVVSINNDCNEIAAYTMRWFYAFSIKE